ncbi:hypothetical protein [Pelagovum pacificum]|uniref:hypothetical protein n=1 Tax=Pelagovum pacificum TaxID=2588711 RepID=UPI0018CD035D|nr:hypothetical protein [Pelagovum pacificum]QQA44185.1 hypothetical protein I8N54_06295 [Pelagovum pacificum]
MALTSEQRECQQRCWLIGAVAGVVVALVCWIAGWLGFFPGLIVGIFVGVLAGLLMMTLVCGSYPWSASSTDTDAGPEPTTLPSDSAAVGSGAPTNDTSAVPGTPAMPVAAPAGEEKVAVAESEADKAEPDDGDTATGIEEEPPTVADSVEPSTGTDTVEPPPAVEEDSAVGMSGAGSEAGDVEPSPDEEETPAPASKTTADSIGATDGGGAPIEDTPVAASEPTAPAEEDRPEALTEARDGSPDNLKEIKGVGPKLEAMLNGLGIYHFDQIAGWTDKELAWIDDNITGFRGRASRDNWIEQAKTLASGGSTDFSGRVKKGDVY